MTLSNDTKDKIVAYTMSCGCYLTSKLNAPFWIAEASS